jgi:hypothetical protein
MTKPTPVVKFNNSDGDLTSFVWVHVYGFSVTLRDNDADEFVSMAKLFKDKDRAVDYAKRLVK